MWCSWAHPVSFVGAGRWSAAVPQVFALAVALLGADALLSERAAAQGAGPSRAVVRNSRTVSAPPPIVFVHGNGDHAGLWDTNIWRFESNGYPRDRLFAVDLPAPLAGSTIDAVELNRSTPDDQVAALSAFVTRVLLRTGAPKVVLVGSSRGGMTIRQYVRFGGGAAHVEAVVTCGTPNHGVMAVAGMARMEFNGAGDYLQRLNTGSEVVAGVRFLTLRSDSLDKYAQPTGVGLGNPAMVTNVTAEGPALRGATNVVIPGTDHREIAFGAQAFAAQYRFVTGRPPQTLAIAPESTVVLDGTVSGLLNNGPTNTPLIGARVAVYAVDPRTGVRDGVPRYAAATGADGRWGPFRSTLGAWYEFEVTAPDSSVIMHLYRSPILRSSGVINFRLPAPSRGTRDSVGVLLVRPRGYLGSGRDTVTIDGTPTRGIPRGIPTVDRVTGWVPADSARTVITHVNGERLAVRTHPRDRRHVVVAEFQHE